MTIGQKRILLPHYQDKKEPIKKEQTLTPLQSYTKILAAAKLLGFPFDFLHKTQNDLMQFMKTKDFMVLLKSKVHLFLNRLIMSQFNNDPVLPKPMLLAFDESDAQQANNMSLSVYRFYTDSTGNNYPVVRQILKRRSWMVRVDKIKSTTHGFDQVHVFWTQWKKNKICS
jgi:hypothetical protein